MSAPFHVLMLPGSKVPGANGETTAVTNGDAGADRADPQAPPPVDTTAPQGAEASANAAAPTKLPPLPPPETIIPEDDYLLTRHRHRVSSVQDASNDSDNKKSGKTNAAAANSGDNNVDDEDAQKSVPVCTPFEIVIINCCDCGAPKKRKERGRSLGQVGEDRATALGIRSTEDNYDGSSSSSPMEEDGSVDGNSSVEYSKVAASSCVSGKSPSSLHVPSQMGHLAEGKEGQFAALIAQHCHTVSDRALALAVLERTMEHDRVMATEVEAQEKDCSMNTSGKKRKREECSASSSSSNEKEIPAIGESAEIGDKKSKSSSDTTLSSVDTDNDGENVGVSNDKVKVSRMANFLSAGGLKILTQWLVDSFTPIQKLVAQAPAKKGKDSGNKRKRKKESAEVETVPETSPTGPLILPLLSILQSIPFEYDLIIECKINKHVKKLKKNVERVTGADSSKKSAIEKKLGAMKKECSHPNSGGMPVIEVYRQIGKLMETWMKAMDENKKESKNVDAKSASSRNDVYHSLKATMSQRLETLSSYEAGKAPKPSWLAKLDPKASAGKGKGIDAEEAARQRQMKEKAAASAKAAKEKAEQEKRLLEAKRRKIQLQEELTAENVAIEENKKRLEQYRRRLQEESELRRGVAVETEKTDHKDKAKGRRMRKVTWADQHSDSSTKLAEVREFVRQEEDEFDADPNLSQEEEDEETESAGFTF
mmetsp:Transcript_21143/g.49892  ORF Transcript_21143/g.49892 Transcript_21143/m.49892 type:complete len:709 (+) Transcript_21143:88-2214(+)